MATVSTRPTHRMLSHPWLLAFVPVNAAQSAFGVALPLLILISLHETWAQVALAATVFNVAIIVSSMFWGHVADRYPQRRRLLVVSYAGTAAAYLVLTQVQDLSVLLAVYACIGILTPAGTNASNLLILEKFPVEERATAFASLQEMSILGALGGLLLGYFWLATDHPLPPLLYALAALALGSAIGVQLMVRDSVRPVAAAQVAHHAESLAARLRHSLYGVPIPFFPKRPTLRPGEWTRFRRWIREEVHHELPLIFAATFLFNLSANLFNISYTPYLVSVGVSSASIFLVSFANCVAQALAFPASGGMVNRRGADRLVVRSTYVRSLGYLAVAGFTFVPAMSGSAAFQANVVAYALLGGSIAFYSTASSIILFRALDGRTAGTLIGVSSAIGGIAAVVGSSLSGVLAVFGSYRLTFLVSAGALLVSVPIWSAAHVASYRRRHPGPAPAAPPPPSVPPRRAPDVARPEID